MLFVQLIVSRVCCVIYSASLAVDHRMCFRSLHAAEFHRQSQVAAAAAAAVAGFSAFNLHSSALAGPDRRYYMPHHGVLSKASQPLASLASCCRDDVSQLSQRCSPADVTARYLQVGPGNYENDDTLRRSYP